MSDKGCVDDSNDEQRMQPGAPGLPPSTSRGTTMSEGTPSTPDEGRAHAVPSFAARETAAVPGTAHHDERQKKTANAPQWRRDIVRQLGPYPPHFPPPTPRPPAPPPPSTLPHTP